MIVVINGLLYSITVLLYLVLRNFVRGQQFTFKKVKCSAVRRSRDSRSVTQVGIKMEQQKMQVGRHSASPRFRRCSLLVTYINNSLAGVRSQLEAIDPSVTEYG